MNIFEKMGQREEYINNLVDKVMATIHYEDLTYDAIRELLVGESEETIEEVGGRI